MLSAIMRIFAKGIEKQRQHDIHSLAPLGRLHRCNSLNHDSCSDGQPTAVEDDGLVAGAVVHATCGHCALFLFWKKHP